MTVVAAVDRSERAQKILEESKRLAEQFATELHVIHVLNQSEFIELERTSVNQSGQPVSMDRVQEIAAEIAQEVGKITDYEVTAVGLAGDPAEEIIEYSRKQNAQYLVVAPRKRTPVGKAIFGSVAQSVLLNSEIPVLSVSDR